MQKKINTEINEKKEKYEAAMNARGGNKPMKQQGPTSPFILIGKKQNSSQRKRGHARAK